MTEEQQQPGSRDTLRDLSSALSDRLGDAELAGLLPRLVECGAPAVAGALVDWVAGQRSTTMGEGLAGAFLSLLRLRGLPSPERRAFLHDLAAALLERVPAHERERLSRGVAPLLLAHPAARPGTRDSRDAEPRDVPRRLTLILDRLDTASERKGSRRPTLQLAKEAVLTATLSATDASVLERSLADLRARGLVHGLPELVRMLVQALPPWPLPDLTAHSAPAVSALERLVRLAPDAHEALHRVHELAAAGVETFNGGALDRAEVVFALIQRLSDDGVVDAAALAPLRENGHARLDIDRLGRLLEGDDRREIPRALLRFFRVFDPQALLDKLHGEPLRQRRGVLLALLEAHGAAGLEAVFARLGGGPEQLQDVFLLRNLVHLLRRIPGTRGRWSPEHELARVVRLLVPENPPLLVREVLAYLGDRPHPVAEQVLLRFLATLEEQLLSPVAGEAHAERLQWQRYLDETCAALARQRTPGARRALVEHALRSEPALGRAMHRLRHLPPEQLAAEPALVTRLVAAARERLPRGLLARLAEQDAYMGQIVAAVEGARSPEVRELLETLATRFPDEDAGRRAARALAAAARASRHGAAEGAALSGDLRAFGVPTLLQNLADSTATGSVRLLDAHGSLTAELELEHGRLAGARCGRLAGEEVVYQLLERPIRGRFAFVPGKPQARREVSTAREVTPLLLEGLRRHDELRRAALLVPDHARLEATDSPPRAVPGEEDLDLVIALWEKIAAGATPRECEGALGADAYRIRRCLVSWVEDGALRPQPAPAARRPPGLS